MKKEYLNPEAEIELFSAKYCLSCSSPDPEGGGAKYCLSCSSPDPEGGGVGEGGNEYDF